MVGLFGNVGNEMLCRADERGQAGLLPWSVANVPDRGPEIFKTLLKLKKLAI